MYSETFGSIGGLKSTIGTGGGVALSALLGSEWHAIYPVCLGLSVVHLVTNYISVRNLGVPTFDSQVGNVTYFYILLVVSLTFCFFVFPTNSVLLVQSKHNS